MNDELRKYDPHAVGFFGDCNALVGRTYTNKNPAWEGGAELWRVLREGETHQGVGGGIMRRSSYNVVTRLGG